MTILTTNLRVELISGLPIFESQNTPQGKQPHKGEQKQAKTVTQSMEKKKY